MSIGLTLLPFDGDDFSHNVLQVTEAGDEDVTLFDRIKELGDGRGRRVPDDFASHLSREEGPSNPEGDSHYGPTLEDAYGDPLQEVEVEDLMKLCGVAISGPGWRNRAVWSYLGHLPPRTKVALYWR